MAAERWLLFPLVARLVLATITFGQQNTLDFQPPKLDWQPCGTNVTCVNMSVPIDWDNPNGAQLSLFMNKLSRYSNASARVGNLIVNPGGPGVAAHGFTLFSIGNPQGSALGDYFDIIGLDPRGVGYSNATRCNDDIRNETSIKWPYNQTRFDQLVDINKRFAQSCLEQTGELVKHVDTVSVAKDMEAVRLALGGEKLNYYGSSYGTQIATTYASLFPKNIRSMVMDGNLDHSTDRTTMFSSGAVGLETAFTHWAEWCDRNETCALRDRTLPGTNETGRTQELWLEVLARADNGTYTFTRNCEPSSCGNQTLEAGDIIDVAYAGLYGSDSWKPLAKAVNNTLDGDFSIFTQDFRHFADEDVAKPPFSTHFKFSLTACLEWSVPSTFAEFEYLDRLGKTIAPLTRGRSLYWDIVRGCVGWPFAIPAAFQRPFNVSQDVAPILIVQSTHDPATPLQGAVNIQRQLPKSVLLIREGDGHTSYVDGNEQLVKIVNDYFVNLTLPDPNVVIRSSSMGDGFGD